MKEAVLVLLCVLSGGVLLPLAVNVFRRTHFKGKSGAVGVLISLSIWSLGYAAELAASDPEQMLMFLKLEYLGLAYLPAWLLLFAFQFNGLENSFYRKICIAAFVFSTLTLFHVLTYPTSTLFYTSLQIETIGSISYYNVNPGKWYWAHTSGFYFIAGVFVLLVTTNYWKKGPLYRHQLLWIYLAVCIPLAGNILYLLDSSFLQGFDPTCILLAFFALLLASGSKKHQLFDIIPFAKDILIEQLRDGVVVSDPFGRIVDMNRAAKTLLGVTDATLGHPITSIFPEEVSDTLFQTQEPLQLSEKKTNDLSWLEIRNIPLTKRSKFAGHVVLIRNISMRKQLEAERECLIDELQEALKNVKQLKGLIPICASCKKIRDDSGYWNQLESFIQTHSEASFSHGICPECSETLYGLSPTKQD